MQNIAVLVPCYNEGLTIGKVIEDFKQHLPGSTIYVYDNNSTDNTYAVASNYEGVELRKAPIQGKGAVVRQMFDEVEADVYLMVDGDATYPAEFAKSLINGINDGYDMMLGDRLSSNYFEDNKRPFHGFGNWLVRFLVNKLYHGDIVDIMTGYRAFTRDFVKSINIVSNGFEIETEMSIFALKNNYKVGSIPIDYKDRPDGSVSKLSTFSDGRKVLKTIFKMRKS